MIYTTKYDSPIGEMTLASSEGMLIGAWIEGQKYYMNGINVDEVEVNNKDEVLIKAKEWLDKYFAGKKPNLADLPLCPGGTSFQREVWAVVCNIPYGETGTYSDIANTLKILTGEAPSSQSVGNAVSHNPLLVIIPCHRVVGKDGSMVGYSGGLKAKEFLLNLEKDSKNNT